MEKPSVLSFRRRQGRSPLLFALAMLPQIAVFGHATHHVELRSPHSQGTHQVLSKQQPQQQPQRQELQLQRSTYESLESWVNVTTTRPGDYLDLPVRVITLSEGSTGKAEADAFGFTTVTEAINRTVDMRPYTIDELLFQNFITTTCHLNMQDGQRRSFEMPSTGAIGCFMSHLSVCSPNHTTLVLEEDAVIDNRLHDQLPRALALIEQNMVNANSLVDVGGDIVIMGPISVFEGLSPWKAPVVPLSTESGFELLGSRGFFGTHGVLYSPRGCKLMNDYFGGPKDMQIDAAMSHYSQHATLYAGRALPTMRVYIETGPDSIYQRHDLFAAIRDHVNGGCCFCHVPADECFPLGLAVALSVMFTIVAMLFVYWLNTQAKKRGWYERLPACPACCSCCSCCAQRSDGEAAPLKAPLK